MQTAFDSLDSEFDRFPIQMAERKLLEALRVAVAEISIKELAYRLDVSPSLLADALAGRANKGVRASWLVTILDMASEANLVEIVKALVGRRPYEVQRRKELTPEELAARFEEKLRGLGAVGLQLIREAKGE